ncbi:MAG TPA: serine/threonine-protein kinase [Gemmatimonadaceae bacterium]|nr:serine/threonine-protein kinase [Gemmatimonadaceae bacterium]
MTGFVEQLQRSVGDSLTIERELGGGAMSHVFLARERTLGRAVVVKVLPPALASAINIERFRREVQLLARLQHTHIVSVLATGDANDMLFYTMPFVEGESLRHRLRRGGALSSGETIVILRDVLGALAYAHKRGVVHRDIKPENILLSEGGALLADFGIAKAMSDAGMPAPTRITHGGVMVGTPAYSAPEQAAADPNVDARADLYSVGAVAYEMLTGAPMFADRAPHLQMAAHATEVPMPIDARRSDVPPRLAELVMQMLAKDPADRPASAEAILHVLDGIATAEGRIRPSAMVRTTRLRWAMLAGVFGFLWSTLRRGRRGF